MTKPLSRLLLAVLTLCSGAALAQRCTPTFFSTGSIRELDVEIGSCRDAQTWLHFTSARGAFGNALNFFLKNPAGDLQVPNTCPLIAQGGTGPVDNCLKYTGECSRTVSPVLGCFPDAQTQSRELNCNCQPQASMGPLDWKAKETFQVEPWFMVDTDLDGKTDNSFWGASPLTTKRMLSWQPWWNSAVTMNWEDNWYDPASDFNDYVATFEVKSCGPERFPPQALPMQQVTCINPCGDNACGEQELKAAAERVRFTAGITVDEINSEIPYEANGRRIQLTLFGYDDFDKQLLNANPRSVAVCPVVNLQWMKTPPPGSNTDLTTLVRYGDPVCTSNPSDLSGSPICFGQVLRSTMPLSFSTNQTAKANCGAIDTGSDIVSTTPSDACAANSLIKHYELSLKAIDKTLSNPDLHLNPLLSSKILFNVESVDVYVVSELKTPFVCPSGANVAFDSVSPGIGKVVQYHLKRGAQIQLDRFPR